MIAPLLAALVAGTWTGTVAFPVAERSSVTVALAASTAEVSLGPAHVAGAQVQLARSNGTLRFVVPGLPVNIGFALRSKGGRLVGTAVQGVAKATVTLHRGTSADATLGFFAAPRVEVARFTRHGFDTRPFAIDLDTGAFGPPPPQASRLAVRQYDVRFRSGKVTLAGTLTLPPGAGPFPAVVYVHGSGDTLREESQWFCGVFVAHGVAVLAYDKRGNGQSGGVYPGDRASVPNLAAYAGDAVAAVRFLASQPRVDATRIGLAGISQAGWIIPQAAVRAQGAVAWAVLESAPTVTQGESDTFASLVAGESIADAEREAHALGPSGYDPVPWIERLAIPALWLYGGADRNVPAGTSMDILRRVGAGHPFTVRFYPGAPHSLFDRRGFPDGLFTAVGEWLDGR